MEGRYFFPSMLCSLLGLSINVNCCIKKPFLFKSIIPKIIIAIIGPTAIKKKDFFKIPNKKLFTIKVCNKRGYHSGKFPCGFSEY